MSQHLWPVGLVLLMAGAAAPRQREALRTASASQEPQSEEPETSPDARWFVFEEETDLVDVLDACVEGLGIPLDYDRSRIQAKVTIRSGEGHTTQSIWTLVNRLLAEKGLACVQPPGQDSLSIVALEEAPKLARLEIGGPYGGWAGYVRVLRTLEQAKPDAVGQTLAKVLTSPGSVVQALPGSGQILLAGLRAQVDEAVDLLEVFDASPAPVVVESVPARYLDPTVLVALLERIETSRKAIDARPLAGKVLADPIGSQLVIVAPAHELGAWVELIERFDQAEALETMDYAPRRFGLRETASLIEEVVGPFGGAHGGRLVLDELTGRLIITATPAQHREVRELLSRLESEAVDPRSAMRAYAVRHRDVDELLELLRDLLEGEGLARLDGTPNEVRAGNVVPENATGGPVRPRAEPDVTLAKDEGTNRILAVGSPRTLDQLGRLIAEIDVKHPQVLVETLIVSLSDSQTRDLAVELQEFELSQGVLGRLSSLFDAGSPNPQGSALPAPGGIGLEGVVLDPRNFSAVLRALETLNRGRSLTIPKVLVNNNQSASLNSVLQTPFASTNASNTVATTSFGGTLDAGTTVTVTPQITDGDQLLLDYSISLSSFVGDSPDPTLPPPRQENRLESVATIPDGYAVVVGGLDVETDTDAESRVPFLGAIPWIGNAFKSRSTGETRSRFFVFLRCSVLRHPQFADLRHLGARDLKAAGIEDGWPALEPRLIL